MICKKRLRDGPTLTITNLVPESSVGVFVKHLVVKLGNDNIEQELDPIFIGKACKREGRDIKIQVPANEKILIRVRKFGYLQFERECKTLEWNFKVSARQQEDNFIFTIHAQDCIGPSVVDRRTAGLRGRTEHAVIFDEVQDFGNISAIKTADVVAS